MALRQIQYEGMTITAAAFQLLGSAHCLVALSIARTLTHGDPRTAALFEPPSGDRLFDDVDDALESALAFGCAIVDGEIPGESLEGL
jgi:hypothetical protein